MLCQRTIQAPAYAISVGVHTGKKVAMTLRPAPADTGIRFVRMDLGRRPKTVRALARNVSDTTLSTSILENGVQVATVEHLMSACGGSASTTWSSNCPTRKSRSWTAAPRPSCS